MTSTVLSDMLNNFRISIDDATKCFNASEICKIYNKSILKWLTKKSTRKIITNNKNVIIFQEDDQVYLGPELYLHFVSWLSNETDINCNNSIYNNTIIKCEEPIKCEEHIKCEEIQSTLHKIVEKLDDLLIQYEEIKKFSTANVIKEMYYEAGGQFL